MCSIKVTHCYGLTLSDNICQKTQHIQAFNHVEIRKTLERKFSSGQCRMLPRLSQCGTRARPLPLLQGFDCLLFSESPPITGWLLELSSKFHIARRKQTAGRAKGMHFLVESAAFQETLCRMYILSAWT